MIFPCEEDSLLGVPPYYVWDWFCGDYKSKYSDMKKNKIQFFLEAFSL